MAKNQIMLGSPPKPVHLPREVALGIAQVDKFCGSMRRINILSSEFLGSSNAVEAGRALRKELRFIDRHVKEYLAWDKQLPAAKRKKLQELPPLVLIGPTNTQRKANRKPTRTPKRRSRA